jgi:hypothetical protein
MWTPSRPTAASAGTQTRRRKLVLDNAAPSGLVNTRAPAGTAEMLAQVRHDQVCEVNDAATSA